MERDMEYLRLLYELPAIVAGATMLAYVSPVKLPPRCAPLLLFLVGLAVWFLPAFIDIPLALTIPAAWIQRLLGIDMHGHDPVKVTLPKLPKKVPLQRFVTQAYGRVGEPAEQPEAAEDRGETVAERPDAGEHEDDAPPPEPEPSATVSDIRKFVPAL